MYNHSEPSASKNIFSGVVFLKCRLMTMVQTKWKREKTLVVCHVNFPNGLVTVASKGDVRQNQPHVKQNLDTRSLLFSENYPLFERISIRKKKLKR